MRQHEIYQAVTDRIIEQIEAGTPPWRRPWMTVGTGLPRNASSGRRYNGINVWLLSMTAEAKGYDSALWATFNALSRLRRDFLDLPAGSADRIGPGRVVGGS